jgi:hypothetical protein
MDPAAAGPDPDPRLQRMREDLACARAALTDAVHTAMHTTLRLGALERVSGTLLSGTRELGVRVQAAQRAARPPLLVRALCAAYRHRRWTAAPLMVVGVATAATTVALLFYFCT